MSDPTSGHFVPGGYGSARGDGVTGGRRANSPGASGGHGMNDRPVATRRRGVSDRPGTTRGHGVKRRHRVARSIAALAGVLVFVAAGISVPPPALAASSPPERVDLYSRGDFVSQTNLVQCVGASMQMMQNMITGTDDRTATTQKRLFDLAVSFGDPTFQRSGGVRGASAQGWAAGLSSLGLGPYRVVPVGTFDDAVALAARAMERTGKPVGLLVWQGAHAWVMSGFEATADPTLDPSARITLVRVLDPLYPRAGGTWGPTPAPDAGLALSQLARVFVPYRPHGRNTVLRGQYVLVLPFELARRVGPGRYLL